MSLQNWHVPDPRYNLFVRRLRERSYAKPARRGSFQTSGLQATWSTLLSPCLNQRAMKCGRDGYRYMLGDFAHLFTIYSHGADVYISVQASLPCPVPNKSALHDSRRERTQRNTLLGIDSWQRLFISWHFIRANIHWATFMYLHSISLLASTPRAATSKKKQFRPKWRFCSHLSILLSNATQVARLT